MNKQRFPAQPEYTIDSPPLKVNVRKYPRFLDPEAVFLHLYTDEPYAFWLDSSRVEEGLARFSFMGTNTGPFSKVLKYDTETRNLEIISKQGTEKQNTSIFDYMKQELARDHLLVPGLSFDFQCGFVGYFGYELKAECQADCVHQSHLPDALLFFADQIIVFDHSEKVMYFLYLSYFQETQTAENWFDLIESQLETLSPSSMKKKAIIVSSHEGIPLQFRFARPYQSYIKDIEICKTHLKNGETYEICLTNSLETDTFEDALALYHNLRRLNPAPYAAFLRFNDITILSSSPECFLKIDQKRRVTAKPIKGTSPRGQTPEEDALLREGLSQSEKNRAENLMIVDLLRNDLGRVCEIGSIRVPKLMHIETYSTVHQLVSTVQGILRPDISPVECFRSAFPGGSMTGAPKLRTMQIIDSLETQARGVYSGAIGFFGLNQTVDLSIVIRTLVITPEKSSIGTGGAIVIQSDPEEEFDEILLKANALIKAILYTEKGEKSAHQYIIVGDRPLQVKEPSKE